MNRLLSSGQLIYSQLDLFMPKGSINRVVGESITSLQLTVFANNCLLLWPLLDGTNIADCNISAGNIYFNGISSASGYYSVRFFPDRVGYWRLVFRELTLNEEVILSYDIVPGNSRPSNDLTASFIRP